MSYDKTIAFPVPDAPHPHWLPILASHGINDWHDRHSDEPITYLGYPLIHSATH